MTERPSSKGLKRFHDVCVAPAPLEAVKGTWHKHRDWVAANVAQDVILDLNLEFWEELGPISQAEDDTPEGQVAAAIRDAGDVVWYAMAEATRVRFESLILERVKAADSQSSVATPGSGGNSTR